jgi:hippurate hydrolase
LTAWRWHLHAHPELSRQEIGTAAFVQARLHEMGIGFEAGIGGHGVVATLRRGDSNRSVGLRADMDALAILERSGVAHSSQKPGVMHACGHDGHTVSLLGAAALLQQDTSWTGTVHLVFQPAEEGAGGAKAMMADGLFARFPMERIFSYHNWPGLAAGSVAVHDGPVMAAGSRIIITIEGVAGHAALPHLTRDPILAAGHLIVGLQSIVARNIDPLHSGVISLGTIEGGAAPNQIPGVVTLRGTCRSFSPETHDVMDDGIRRVAAGVAAMIGVEISVDLPRTVAVTQNHLQETELAVSAARVSGLVVRRDLPPAMTGEDFGAMLAEIPGAYVWIGNGVGPDLHNDSYDFNDAILPGAARYLANVAKQALSA